MTQADNSNFQPHQESLGKRMVIGAGIGLLLISIFIIPAEANPTWGKLWMIRPLVITPMAGAMAGLCNYFLVNFHDQVRLNKTIATILSIIIFIVGLFLGLVLGMDGTLWD